MKTNLRFIAGCMACLSTVLMESNAPSAPTSMGSLSTASEVERVRSLLEDRPTKATTPADTVLPAMPEIMLHDDGTIHFLCAAPGRHFRLTDPISASAEDSARRFLSEHAAAFGISSKTVSNLITTRVQEANGRHYMKFAQHLNGLRVFGAQAIVQINIQRGVEYVVNQMARHVDGLTTNAFLTLPELEAEEVAARAQTAAATEVAGQPIVCGTPQLIWFAPELVGFDGPVRLAWRVWSHTDDLGLFNRVMLFDVANGALLFQHSLTCSALNRTIFDANNDVNFPPKFPAPPPLPERIEGGPSSSVNEVNSAYAGIADVYNFYLNQHGRHGMNGSDLPIFSTVRVCQNGQACPWANAQWSGLPDPPFGAIPGLSIDEGILLFGDGWTADEVVAHEYTHGVTQFESGLIYANASGAINEAFSDIWGEFVDWGNGRGNDATSVKWDVGEDLTSGRIRSMSNPAVFPFYDADRLGSVYVKPPTNSPTFSGNDFGGVHSNSGIVNKLCYLLTEGDTFNGYTIAGLGMNHVANLFYEVNAHLLPGTADYTDLSVALHQAASNLGWNATDIANLHRACLAVEITGNNVDVTNANASPNGCRQAGVGAGGPFPTLAQGINAIPAGDPLNIRGTGSHYNERLRISKPMSLRAYGGTAVIGRP